MAKSIYLSKNGKSFGPFDESEIDELREKGELDKFQWICHDLKQGWAPIGAPPALPSLPGMESQSGSTPTSEQRLESRSDTRQDVKQDAKQDIKEEQRPQIVPSAGRNSDATRAHGSGSHSGESRSKSKKKGRGNRETSQPSSTQAEGTQNQQSEFTSSKVEPPPQEEPSPVQFINRTDLPDESQFPVNPVSPVNPEARYVMDHMESYSHDSIVALCHNFKTVLSGSIKDINSEGCTLTRVTPHSDSMPVFHRGSRVHINLLDSKSSRSENVEARIHGAIKNNGVWDYRLRWESKLPNILKRT